MVDFAIVLVIILAVTALMNKELSDKDKTIEIGGKQYAMLSSYAEGEKALEYIKLAAELALAESAGSCELAKTIPLKTIEYEVGEKVKKRTADYVSSDTELSVSFLPYYTFSAFENIDTDSLIGVTGITSEDIHVDPRNYNFNYSVSGNFRTSITCEKLNKLKGTTAQQLTG